ncbi:WD40 repeat-like protein [Mycena venus]|uniref:WD40 repeat-like protein n=1 Tax=Mycena venus TaxID=2733690 RepID=A0A8H6Y976_9AGAR|nr:WD40 repeat-like protein [Mycena venus]
MRPRTSDHQTVNNYISGGRGGHGGEGCGQGTGGPGGRGMGPTLNYYIRAGNLTMNNHNNDPIQTVTKVRHRVPFLGEDAILENLAPVDEARFDHETSADSCLQGTRETMLGTMFEWIDSLAPGPLIFWLAGLAGTGKTTIATTVCEQLDAREAQRSISPGHSHPAVAKLGADFFMSRHSAPRRNPHSIVCTIAYQLADRFPSTRPFLTSALRLNPRIVTSKNMEKKIMELIIGPLVHAINTLPNCIVIVLDALDECDGHGAEFLPLFARLTSELGGVRVKLVITSRLETDIRSMFSTIGHAAFRLHDIEKYIVQADIQLYLQHSFRQVLFKKPHFPPGVEWPSPKDISTLVSRSGTLFIYAATVVKFVGATGHSPERRLELLLKSTTKTTTAVGLQMLDSLYMEVLRIAVTDAHSHTVDEDLAKRMQHVVGAVVLLQVPVSVQTLSRIMDVNSRDVQLALDGVAAMLLIPPSDSNDPIRIFHPSFPDFLLDPNRCSDMRFGVQAGMLHSQLTRRCMVIMNTSLHYDMCDLRNPSMRNAEVKDLSERIDRYILPELLYACKFWKAHLELTIDDSPGLADKIQSFVLTKLLAWIECLSILFSISVALPALGVAQVWCTHRNMDDEIERLESIRNFVLYEPKVADSALHIYQIAAFHPAFNVQSKVHIPSDLKVRLITSPSQEWSNQPGIFGRHRDGVTCLAISPNGSKLASGSKDTFVRIWDVEMGHCILETAGHTVAVCSVAFSPDGSQLVSAGADGSIRVWDVQTGLTLVQFIGHCGMVNSVVYTTDGERVVSGSEDETIRIWSIESGQEEVGLDCHFEASLARQFEVLSLSISQGGTLVSCSVDGVVRLWDMAKTECTQEVIRLGYSARFATAFSPDTFSVAIGHWDKSFSIWNTNTGAVEATLDHHRHVSSLTFSPDGCFVASGHRDGSIRIWKVSSRSLLGELSMHTKEISSMVFSADSRRLFSSSADTTIRVWSLFDGAPSSSRKISPKWGLRHRKQRRESKEGHSKSVLSVAFSPR